MLFRASVSFFAEKNKSVFELMTKGGREAIYDTVEGMIGRRIFHMIIYLLLHLTVEIHLILFLLIYIVDQT